MIQILLLATSIGIALPVVCPLLGIALLEYQTPINVGIFSVAVIFFYYSVLAFSKKRSSWLRTLIAASLCLIVATSLSSWRLTSVMDKALPAQFHNVDVRLELNILEVVQREYGSLRIRARVNKISSGHENLPVKILQHQKIQFSWRISDAMKKTISPKIGDTWELPLRLKSPRGLANPGGFHYRAWLLSQNIVATGYVKGLSVNKLESEKTGLGLEEIRSTLDKTLFANVDIKHRALFRAMSLGFKDEISERQWEVLTKTGTSHLMAISGLHVGLFALFGFIIGRAICTILNILGFKILWMINTIPPCLSVVFSIFYAALSGFALPTQRAMLMVVMINLAVILQRRFSAFVLLGVVWCIVVLYSPLSLLSPGLWLSFSAVASLFWVFFEKTSEDYTRSAHYFLRKGFLLVKLQCALWCCMLFVLIALNVPVSLVSPVANFIAVPLISFITIPGVFLALLLGGASNVVGSTLLELVDFVTEFLWKYLEILSEHSHLVWHLDVSVWGIVFGTIGMFMVFLPVAFHLRSIGIAFVLIAWFWQAPDSRQPSITVLDVGQGLSVVAQDENETFIYDVGARFSPSFDIGEQIVAPFLRYRGKQHVDLAVLSHGDNDHSGGFNGLANEINVLNVASNHEITTTAEGIKKSHCYRGDTWTVAGFVLEVIWPLPSENHEDSNNQSCVILMSRGDFKMLLTGDIEKSAEYRLLDTLDKIGPVDVVLAPHHGSNTSSTYAFISAVQAKHVVFSHGYKNRYRHPSKKVIERYQAFENHLWSTADHGAITFLLRENELTVTTERLDRPKPWFQKNDNSSW